jgi:response regulator RpfG family c-di-GMP phosphodiesterase
MSAETSNSRAILVVDDEEGVLSAIKSILEPENYEVVATSDPLRAIQYLQEREFALIISDQRMPAMSGLKLLSHARNLRPDTTRILITAFLNLDTVVDAINKGEIFRFILKPWIHEEFVATIRNGLQRYELICQNERLQAATQAMNERLVELNRSLEEQIELVGQKNQELGQANLALDRNLTRSLELCVHTMETFYPALGNQARRIFRLCQSIAQTLNLSEEERRVLEGSALLCDIGLVGIPRNIIRRWQQAPVNLTPPEKTLIEQHPILGHELARFTSDLDQVGIIIRAHHERFDGSGFPDQLAGENIPWLARLLAVAVAFACTTAEAPEALQAIQFASGSAFDPDAVRVFLRSLPTAELPRKERQVGLDDLRPGMVLSRGIYTGNGLLLIPQGQCLNYISIEKLLNHNRIQPLNPALTVYC